MSRILRHEVMVERDREIAGQILHVAARREDVVEVWAHEPVEGAPARTYTVIGTGQAYDGWRWEHVGTAVTPSGQFVWHLLRRVPS